tara:strand:- start:321 stop:1454 length:1134 start_codon:yes stop_codon:yes gene_type:complete
MGKNIFIILAGGQGKRFNNKLPKQYINIGKYNSIELIINEIVKNNKIDNIVIACTDKYSKKLKKIIKNYKKNNIIFVKSGKTRQDSSYLALKKIKSLNPKYVLIHDASRPNIKNESINKILKHLKKYDGSAPLIKNVDLIRKKINNKYIEEYSDTYSTQTPQGFKYKKIINAYKNNINKKFKDDISLMNNKHYIINFFEGEKDNIKITYKKDIKYLNYKTNKYGIGYDIHKFDFKSKKKLKLCGVKINYYPLIGHSDADVGYHALCDSIFGALGLGDIGMLFPNNESRWKNINSSYFLKFAKSKINEINAEIINIDINFICENPNISLYSNKMKENIAKILKINKKIINIKATTNEKISFIGKNEGIASESIISINF